MSIKATFPAGEKTTAATGLYQWDYGQTLEIESVDIGSEIVEVHFACPNMSEAIVRPCSFSNGVGDVAIPDACLEQSATLTAWIYRISGTQGHTIKTITLPITARIRPSAVRDIPQEISDKYTTLITEVNEAVDNLEKGNITVANATNAEEAKHAASASNSASANYAVSAGSATKAGAAEKATSDINGKKIHERYLHDTGIVDVGSPTDGVPVVDGCYVFIATLKLPSPMGSICFGVIFYDGTQDVYSASTIMDAVGCMQLNVVDGKAYVVVTDYTGSPKEFPFSDATLELRYLNNTNIS